MKLSNATVVVTGVSALIGQGIVSGLQNLPNVSIIGVDKRFTQYARKICKRFIIKPDFEEHSDDYVNFWRELIVEHAVNLIVPGISIDVDFFSRNRKAFRAVGCEIVLNNEDLIRLCHDKWAFHEKLQKHNFITIPSSINTEWDQLEGMLGKPPYIFKPRKGEGSQGIVLIEDKIDFDYWSKRNKNNYIVQTIVGNDENEFTVGTFGLGGGEIIDDIIIMRRKLSRSGSTVYASIVNSTVISDAVRAVSLIFQPIGPTNFQFRLAHGTPYLLEINPRFSSSTSMKVCFGFNEAAMSMDFYLLNKTPECTLAKSGTIERITTDVLWTN